MSRDQKLGEWLSEKPFTLAMSSGFFGFFAHAGVVAALEERGLSPTRVVGSSAGALIAGLSGAGIGGQDLCETLLDIRLGDFLDPRPGLGLLRGNRFRRLLRDVLPVDRFEECPVPVRISVFDIMRRETVVFSEGELATAIHASCAIPVLFQPVHLGGRWLADGGVLDRPGLAGAVGDGRVFYHHLSSRSPWRRRGSHALRIPARPDMKTLSIPGLTRVGPLRLERGVKAMEQAKRAALNALECSAGEALFTGGQSDGRAT